MPLIFTQYLHLSQATRGCGAAVWTQAEMAMFHQQRPGTGEEPEAEHRTSPRRPGADMEELLPDATGIPVAASTGPWSVSLSRNTHRVQPCGT